jgi:hypothetical protein
MAGSSEALAQKSGSTSIPWTPLQYGFTMALLGNNSQVRSMGFQWVSYTVGWDSAEPSPGVYDWGNADNIANAARNAGINVMIRVSRSPQWARDPSCSTSDTCPPADPRTFGDFMGALADHVSAIIYPYKVAYEIWNEPNVSGEWGGLCPNPEFYGSMVRAAYPRIKANAPNAIVVAGAVTTVGEVPTNECHLDDILFLQRFYATGVAPYFDVLSDHPYGFISAPEADPTTVQPPLVFRRAERHRQIMVDNGDSGKQMWATELGWALDPALSGSSCPRPDWYFIFSPQQQADYLYRAYQWARSYWPWMGAMFTFNFDFSEASWYDQCHPFRFWSVKGRPAQSALASLAQNPPPTWTPVVDNPPVFNAVRYNTVTFSRAGGDLTVDADVSDQDTTDVASVTAAVRFPGGSTQDYPMTLVAGTTRSGTWRVTIPIPSNSTGGNVVYTVTPWAQEAAPRSRVTNGPSQNITVTNTRFLDVPADYWAFQFIDYLAGAGIISGYSDNTFRPANNATRGQFSKMIVLSKGWAIDTTGGPHFTDVLPGSAFYEYVETAYNHGVISGYADATFRPNNSITRGQISKIIVLAEGWAIDTTGGPHFTDVPPTNAFYREIETAFHHGIVSGYADNTFRWGNNATRAQLSKMLYLALTGTEVTATSTETPTPEATVTQTPTTVSTATGTPTAHVTLTETATGTVTPGSKGPPPATVTIVPGH